MKNYEFELVVLPFKYKGTYSNNENAEYVFSVGNIEILEKYTYEIENEKTKLTPYEYITKDDFDICEQELVNYHNCSLFKRGMSFRRKEIK